jgi:hypothetical protein
MGRLWLLLLFFVVPVFVSSFSCYQEFANVSTFCGGLVNGSYQVFTNDFSFRINYSKPVGVLNSSVWMVRHGDRPAYNQSIPSGCWGQNPLQFRIYSFFADGTSTTYCFNGASWQQLVSMSSPACSGYNSLGHELKLVDGDWNTWAKGNMVASVTAWSDAFNGGGCVNASVFEDAMYWVIPDFTYFNISIVPSFGEYFSFIANTTAGANVSFVNFSVSLPNGSLVVYNSSFVNGFWVSPPILALNGSYTGVAYSVNTINVSLSFSVSDLWYVSSPDYLVVSAGNNVSSDLSFLTGSLANLSFSSSCVLNSSFFNCSISQNFSVVNSSFFHINIFSAIFTPNDVYYGNLTFIRVLDGRVLVLPLTVGVSSSFGVPVLVDDSDWTTAIQSSSFTSRDFVLLNNGSFPLSNCSVSFDGSLQYVSFSSFVPTNFSVPVNGSTNFSVLFSNPPIGFYQGVMSVSCVASGSGIFNSLAVNNRPFVSVFSYPVYSGGGVGGGGGGSNIIVVQGAGNETLFTVETDAGAIESFLYMYPAQTRQQTIILRSGVITDQVLSVSCSGSFCVNVKVDKSSVKLSGKQDALVFMSITVPASTPYGSTFDFDVKVADALQHSALLKYHIEVSRLSSWYSKFGLFCQKGDSCLWLMLGDFGVPKLVLYLLLLVPATLFVLVVVPDPKRNKAFRDVKPLLYIVVDLAVLLIASVLI